MPPHFFVLHAPVYGVLSGAVTLQQAIAVAGSKLFARSSRDRLLADLAEMANLPTGWDSYSAPTPASMAIENAVSLIKLAYERNVLPNWVEPSAMGGVGVTFKSGQKEVVVEFYNKGTAHSLFADDAIDSMTTKPVLTNEEGFGLLLDEVQVHLYGQSRPARTT